MMIVIDLSQPIYNKMPVYPGDPEVAIKKFLFLAKDGWNMNTISLPAHIGTHVNVPIHGIKKGKTLDDYLIGAFMGKSAVFKNLRSIKADIGIFFEQASINDEAIKKIIEIKPKFVGVQGYFESEKELGAEKLFLKQGIISFEGLINIDKLKDKQFVFYGLPLKIKDGDGSPIRAVAIL